MGKSSVRRIGKLLKYFNWFSIDKYGNEVWNNNCLSCLYYYTSTMMSLISPMRCKCRHMTKNYDGEPEFWYSKRGLIIPIIFLLINLSGTVLFLYDMLSSCSEDRLKCLLELHDHILIINTIILIILLQFKMKIRAEELNDLIYIIQRRKYFGMKNLICSKCGESIYMINHMSVTVSGALIVFFGFAIFVNKGTEIFNYHDFCMFVCQGVQFSIAAQVSQKLAVMRVIYKAVHRALKKRLKTSILGRDPEDNLVEDLRKFIHLYLNLKVVMSKVCDFMNPILIVWLLSHIALCVFNCYALIQVINIQPAHVIIFAQARTTVTILVIISIFSDSQQVLNETKKTLNLLFSCPFTKLSHMEGLMLEALIETITTQAPEIHGSKMLTVGTDLISSVSGAIVTYLLVVLQFKPFD